MNKFTSILLSAVLFLMNNPLKAQDSAESLVQRTAAKLEKDGGITMNLSITVRDGFKTDIREVTFDMSGDSFRSTDDENTIWFDGKTLWRGSDFGSGIEEIYISEPLADEAARFNLIRMLKEHEGFSVTGNGHDTFTLTASDNGSSIAGISSITVKVDPATNVIRRAYISFSEETGDMKADISVLQYSPDKKFDGKTFKCPVKEYKDADIIDLR
ncbi:MAG: hypothetical protein IK006_09015 [Bacteroidaceae bacterium]|nr:hypothetical protein [Bacteroidaceae bacterium]